ncbi:hypothetical protein [Vulcanococcus limneticus]|uniref:hypothetical protein n=1 Tax=Vulcanococcus limneticus TaxID=2170428 RepID=UPI00398BCB51
MSASILEKIKSISEDPDYYTVQGEFEPDVESNTLIIRNNKYSHLRVDSTDIDVENTFAAENHEVLSGGKRKLITRIRKGAEVELTYKSCTHKFILDLDKERPFYIDQEREEVVFLDQIKAGLLDERNCAHYILIFYAECCEGGKRVESYGLAGCNNGFKHRNCC